MHGYAINPARDFGPRLFTVVAGFKNNGLTDGGYVFWVPIVGPLLGRAGRRRGLRFLASADICPAPPRKGPINSPAAPGCNLLSRKPSCPQHCVGSYFRGCRRA